MKAIIYTEYGSPDVLQVKDVEKPVPQDDQVLVRVHATSANALDWHLMRGEPFLARLENGWQKPAYPHLGADFAGTIEAVGKDITEFQIGDAVFGEVFKTGLGAFGEYVTVRENAIAHKPENLSFEQAAAVPIAAMTALQGLRNKGQIRAGQKVLVNGASGGVGTFAVQIAKALNTEVTGVCSTRNLELVRSIGADHVIDYTKEDFCNQDKQYDLIFDVVGNRSLNELLTTLTPDGICCIGGFQTLPRLFEHMIGGALVSNFIRKEIGLMETVHTEKVDLLFLTDLLASGAVIPVIDRCYPFEETADAIRYLETGRARGKVIITLQ